MKEFSRSQAVMFTSNVVVSKMVLDRNMVTSCYHVVSNNRPLTGSDNGLSKSSYCNDL